MFRNGMIAFMAKSIALIAVIGVMMVRFPHPNLPPCASAVVPALYIVPIYPLFRRHYRSRRLQPPRVICRVISAANPAAFNCPLPPPPPSAPGEATISPPRTGSHTLRFQLFPGPTRFFVDHHSPSHLLHLPFSTRATLCVKLLSPPHSPPLAPLSLPHAPPLALPLAPLALLVHALLLTRSTVSSRRPRRRRSRGAAPRQQSTAGRWR